jgi:signal transduction histidine kinase
VAEFKSKINNIIKISPVITLGVGLIASCLVALYVDKSIEDESRERLRVNAREIQDSIQRRMERYENALTSTRSFLKIHPQTTRNEFKQYISQIELLDKYPGIQGIGLAIKVPDEKVPAFERNQRKTGLPDYAIWPKEPAREEYFPILYLEPMGWRNKRALSFDMTSEPIRREAMVKARETGEAHISSKVILVQETEKNTQPGFLMYLPISMNNEFFGYVYAPFRARHFFRSLLSEERVQELRVRFEVFEGDGPDRTRLLYDSDQKSNLQDFPSGSDFLLQKFEIKGKTWSLYIWPSDNFTNIVSDYSPLAIMLMGSSLSFLFFWFLHATEQARRKAELLASDLNKALFARDEFLSIASHELKSPLTAMKLQAQLNLREMNKTSGGLSPERVLTFLNSTNRQVDNLARLVEDMLDISRINLGKLTLQKDKLNLSLLVNEVIDRYCPENDERACIIHKEIQEEVITYGDRFRMEQVLSNLITNAIKYGKDKPITVSLKLESHQAILKVIDQGLGIAEENQGRIFQRFERAISSHEISGLGLGLYIVRHILEMHRGRIEVQSQLGEGSSFIVTLPLV